jgi:hypothetical protein
MNNTPTPRTDEMREAYSVSFQHGKYTVDVRDVFDFARKLERELAEAKSEIEMLNIRYAAAEMCHANNMDEVTKQRDALAEKVRWMEEQEALYTIIE